MSSVWQQLTLANVPLYQWAQASLFYRLTSFMQAWRQSSWLLQWADQIGWLLLALVFSFAPFVSTALIGVLLVACAGFWVLLTVTERDSASFTSIHLLVLLYWGIATVATALSPVKTAAFSGWVKLTLYLLLFALMGRILRSQRLRNWLLTVYLHVTLVVSIYGLRQWFFGAEALATWVDQTSTLAKTTRVYSYLGNPNLLAGYLIPAVAFSIAAMFVWRRWTTKALAVVMTVVNSACLILTFSRGGWIGFLATVMVLVVLLAHWWSIYLPRFWRRWAVPILLGTTTALIVVAVVAVEPLRGRVASIFAGREDSSNNFRINVWTAVIEMIRDYPWLGIGPGNTAFNSIYPIYQRPRFSALSAYSIFLEIAVETGLIGLTAFLWLLLVTVSQGWKQLQRLRQQANRQAFWLMGALAGLVGMLAHGLVDTVWYRPQVSMLWWLIVALVASYIQPTHAETATTEPASPQAPSAQDQPAT